MNESAGKVETTAWDIARKVLHDILPSAVYFTPESLLSAAEEAGLRAKLIPTDEYGFQESDASNLQKLLADAQPNEPIILITDCSFRPDVGPFVLLPSQCKRFADAHLELFRENVISGADVIIICSHPKFIALYHHEGRVAFIRATPD